MTSLRKKRGATDMTAAMDSPLATCTTLLEREGEVICVFDEEFRVKVSGEDTGGAYAVLSGSVAPGGGPPLHAHPTSETIYVLSGEFAVTRRDARGVSTMRVGPGAVVHAPGGAPHRFENVSPTRSALLMVVSAELLAYIRELGRAFPPGSSPDLEKMLALNTKYRVETFYGEEGSRPEPPKDGATSERARALAWRFGQANDALIATIEGCTPEQWRAICADTGWTVGVQAHHIAVNEAVFPELVRNAVAGHPLPPMSLERLDAINARHAEEFAAVTIAETAALLRESGPRAARYYRDLTDEQLAVTFALGEGHVVSVADLIEGHALDEIERHGEYIRRAIRA
jgi:quercetin dioxygenase-like cupin family protein